MAEPAEEPVAAPAPAVRFASDRPRSKQVPLEWPLEFGGRLYDSITIRRCTGTEISEYVIATAAGQDVMPPVVDCPKEVYDALDDDDLYEVDKVVRDFLPRRFREATEPTPEVSGSTSTKSATPSAEVAPK
ncbi:hypothetical protein [Devosia riboflavina]|uniref:hypothetical protein n=1 Tax=Devosia riboflavina TaxID=46914 RepID=UPI00068DEB2E|nr:hypothetical protein [Devosia riboflavina]